MRAAFAIVVWLGLISTARAQVELKNDGFQSGGLAAFQDGFVSGEAGASRFVAPEAGRKLQKVTFLFGGEMGAMSTHTVTIKVWDDTAGTNAPGGELFSGDFAVTGNNTAFQQTDVSGNIITLPQQFRVGIYFTHDGAPSIASDTDGTIAADKNFIYAGAWIRSQSAGLMGDWVIRAEVSATTNPGTPDAGVTPDAGSTGGGSCSGNADCPVGQFCDLAVMKCTFECRTDNDCGGGGATCNSLGQCLDGDGGGCGCRTDGSTGPLGLCIALALLVITRRKCATR
jgi:hypothetical protein